MAADEETGLPTESPVDWVPLPEVKSEGRARIGHLNRENTPEYSQHMRYAYSSPVLRSSNAPNGVATLIQQHPSPVEGQTPVTNLTIMSIGSSSTGQTSQITQQPLHTEGPPPALPPPLVNTTSTTTSNTSSSSTVTREGAEGINIDSAQLDALWKQFLETVMLPRNPSHHACTCSCHVTTRPLVEITPTSNARLNVPHSLGKPPHFSVSPPTINPLIPEKTNSKPHFKTFIPVGQAQDRNQMPLNNTMLNDHDTANTQPDSQTSTPVPPHPQISKETQTSSTYVHNPTKSVLINAIPPFPNQRVPPTLEKVSLQEACQLLKKDFIRRSEERQENIKRKAINRPLLPIHESPPPLAPLATERPQPLVLS